MDVSLAVMSALVPTRIDLARPLPPLTYLAPEGLPVGVRVEVRLRGGRVLGVVLGPDPTPPERALRPVEQVLDPFPLLPPRLLALMQFASRYYVCGLAHLVGVGLPQGVKADWEAELPDGRRLRQLREVGAWEDLARLGEAWHGGALEIPRLLHHRDRKGAGLAEVRLGLQAPPARLGPSQARVLQVLRDRGGTLLERDLLAAASVGAAVLTSLEAKGLIERTKRLDLLAARREDPFHKRVQLNAEQQRVLEAIPLDRFGTHLLFGVTGSGKTEVYLDLAERTLARGRRVLWLVPEIGLTPRLLARLEARFPGGVAVGHAALNPTERQADVVRLLQDEAPIFVGVRSAVLAPIRNLGLIIVDEEQETSYKSEEHPRIHARDLAIKRAQLEDCPVLLGSATPSLESWQAAQEGRYALLRLQHRPGAAVLPAVQIVDLRLLFKEFRRRVVFAPVLLKGIRDVLERKEQAMLLLNRRGYENFWLCRACGKVLQCVHCDVSLVFHKGAHRLRCHLCGYEASPPEACPDCGEPQLRGVGEGTEQIEHLLAAEFPGARILRLDRDTTRRRGTLEAGLLLAEQGEVDILVGTQMLAKGHTFPRLTLVGVLNADLGLRVPDFRAGERTFQLLTQVAGRAGRADLPGRVVIQTYNPEHPAIVHALAQNFPAFAEAELPYRKALSYPPFAALSLLRGEGDSPEAARAPLATVKARLQSLEGIRVLGPLEAPVPRLKDRFRMQLLLKAWDRRRMGEAIQVGLQAPLSGTILDRDPVSLGV